VSRGHGDRRPGRLCWLHIGRTDSIVAIARCHCVFGADSFIHSDASVGRYFDIAGDP